jgi:hypothetical protein
MLEQTRTRPENRGQTFEPLTRYVSSANSRNGNLPVAGSRLTIGHGHPQSCSCRHNRPRSDSIGIRCKCLVLRRHNPFHARTQIGQQGRAGSPLFPAHDVAWSFRSRSTWLRRSLWFQVIDEPKNATWVDYLMDGAIAALMFPVMEFPVADLRGRVQAPFTCRHSFVQQLQGLGGIRSQGWYKTTCSG